MRVELTSAKETFLRGLYLSVGAAVVAMGIVGCSGFSRSSDLDRESVARVTPPEIKTVNLSISKAQLQSALEQDVLTSRLRVIQIYASQESGPNPLYRLFDVHPQSVYSLLGLKNADILVAANQRYLRNPGVFKSYVRLLPQEEHAQIEVVRGSESLLLNYTFTR